MQARFPAAPVSPAYSLMSHDHVKLKYLFDLIKPAVVMVQDGPTFERALKALDLNGVTVIHVARPCEGIKEASPFATSRNGRDKDVETSSRRREIVAAIDLENCPVRGVRAPDSE